jgi:hypothetical protein
MQRKYVLESKGVDFNFVVYNVTELLSIPVDDVWRHGKYKHLVAAPSLICYWAIRELRF